MGEIVQHVADRYGATKGVYVSESGYIVPVAPKTRTKADLDNRGKHITIPDYTLEQLKSAEQEYVKLCAAVKANYSEVFTVNILARGSRIACVKSVVNTDEKDFLNTDSSFFVINLQSGLVHNVPLTRMGEVVSKELLKAKYANNISNNGFTVNEALEFVAETKDTCSAIFANHGHVMSDKNFAVLIGLFRLRTAGAIFGDLVQWVPYIVSGIAFDSIKFAFNRRMWGGAGATPVPLTQIEQFKDLPIEWARKLIIA